MNVPFYCEMLRTNEKNIKLIEDFEIYREAGYKEKYPDKILGLEAYLKECAWNDDHNGLVRIYLVKDIKSDEIVAYFGLKAGMIAANLNRNMNTEAAQQLLKDEGIKLFPEVLPGIEISHFAINDRYRDKILGEDGRPVRGLGRYIFPEYIYPIIRDVGTKIGVHLIYLYAAGDDKLTSYYEDAFGFHEITEDDIYTPLQPQYDNGCTFMYQLFINEDYT